MCFPSCFVCYFVLLSNEVCICVLRRISLFPAYFAAATMTCTTQPPNQRFPLTRSQPPPNLVSHRRHDLGGFISSCHTATAIDQASTIFAVVSPSRQHGIFSPHFQCGLHCFTAAIKRVRFRTFTTVLSPSSPDSADGPARPRRAHRPESHNEDWYAFEHHLHNLVFETITRPLQQ